MPFEGRHLAKIREMRRLCPVRFPLDLLVRRPEEIDVRYRGGDPVLREGGGGQRGPEVLITDHKAHEKRSAGKSRDSR